MISLSGTSTSVAWFRDEWCCSAKCATSKYNSNIKVHPRENTENVWKKCTASSLRFEHVSSLKQTLQSHHMSSPLAPLVPLPLRVTGLAPRAFSLDTWQDSITKQHGGSMWLVAHHRPSSSFIILHHPSSSFIKIIKQHVSCTAISAVGRVAVTPISFESVTPPGPQKYVVLSVCFTEIFYVVFHLWSYERSKFLRDVLFLVC